MKLLWAKFRTWPTWVQAVCWVVLGLGLAVTGAVRDEEKASQSETTAQTTVASTTSTVSPLNTTTSDAEIETESDLDLLVDELLEHIPGIVLPEPSVVISLLDQLVIAEEHAPQVYDRASFEHWTGPSSCNTRCLALARQRLETLPGLPGGGWLSIYDNYWTDDPGELEIDHVVALAEAWRSGAWEWDEARRREFANDLDSPQLIAVTMASNRSKSDKDPANWQPSNRDAWCDYAASWIMIKSKWGLTADQAEVDALRNMLRGCGGHLEATPPTSTNTSSSTLPSQSPTTGPEVAVVPLLPPATATPLVTEPHCDPAYPDICVPPYPPDLNCKDIPHKRFRVLPPDPHGFDRDKDGIGCES
ncbi:MAG: HNH endonuclease family protein [Acidimicrobiia bacterium]